MDTVRLSFVIPILNFPKSYQKIETNSKYIPKYFRRISNDSDGSYFGTDLLEVERKQVRDGWML